MEAVAKFDFLATEMDELSFKKGDEMLILGTNDVWFRAESRGGEGFVPKNYIELHLPRWFQEGSSRAEAQESLMAKPIGSFLIRGCQSSPGDFSISVRHEADVQHFKVMRDCRGQYFLWEDNKFPSVNKLVDFYKRHSVSRTCRICLLETELHHLQGAAPSLPPPPTASYCPPDPIPTPPLQPAPPPSLDRVQARFSFTAEEKDELDFAAGDVIEVLERPDPSWWKGRLRGRTGLFPSNYTSPL